ncbi:MAG: hypothetical protein QMC03_02615 [Flavobacteriales bacterium]|jgi:hypothetical protein|tara:strand:+ start:2875 stop:3216 length:342 start_codon:yes stop_codon:yes gene_type:complete
MKIQLVLGLAGMLAFTSCQENTTTKVKETTQTQELSKDDFHKNVKALSGMIEKALRVEVDNTVRAKRILGFIKKSKLDSKTAKKTVMKVMAKSKTPIEDQKEITFILNKKIPN